MTADIVLWPGGPHSGTKGEPRRISVTFGESAKRRILCWAVLAVGAGASPASGQSSPPQAPPQAAIEKLGQNLFRVGAIRVDTAKRELSVTGKVNGNVTTLEFVANTQGGLKAYESAIELDTNAIFFNTACILIGLDRARSVLPLMHFDRRAPEGDPVDVTVSWQENGRTRQVNAEQLLYDRENKRVITNSRWVYTGSMILDNGMFLADAEGALIGFVHTPAPIIENVSGDAVNRYGSIVMNEELGLKPGTVITLTVKALAQPRR
jgi:hypothetical protein